MEHSLKNLAQTLDDWAAQKRAFITETDELLAVVGLSAQDAKSLAKSALDVSWKFAIEDATEAAIGLHDVSEDFSPFKVTITKDGIPSQASSVVTNVALADWLSRPPERTVLWVARLETAFESHHVRYAPWGDATEFISNPIPSSPRKFVRDSSTLSRVPDNLGQWLLKEGAQAPWNDSAARVWINLSAAALFVSLTNEIEPDGTLMFRGPPVSRYTVSTDSVATMSPDGFEAVQAAARWIYESERDAETRHGLLAAELARTNVPNNDASLLFERGSSPSLEGAKIALQLGLHKLSLDSLKAMADLRKAVTDETTKLSDATRQLATAVAGALFAGVGVIAARLTISINSPVILAAILILGIVLFAYVGSVIASGYQFVRIQRELRVQWRERLYRFLPEAEYSVMVTKPAAEAEAGFKIAAWIGGILAALLLLAVSVVSFVPLPSSQNGPGATTMDKTGQIPSKAPSLK
ncbi:hypothetical protein [Bradyrhizobium sp. STM 3561]|uniref:hypothetical protein n=1 Tax=Bradyrhizobium sp. STM 3561 TaxID=578923 RepID=UPI00388DDA06